MKRSVLTILAIMAFALGSFAQVWITQNSGLAASRGITDMFAVDASIVWAAAYDGTAPTNPCQDFTKTTNGGTAWTAGTINGATGLCIANIVAIDGGTAWAVTYYPSGTGALNGIFATTNGGTTWTRQATAAFTAASFPDCVYFWDADNGWCLGDPVSNSFEIYTTTDGGNTWIKVPSSQIPAPLSGEYGVVGYFSVVGNTVWVGTNKGRCYKSTDKGNNWTVAVVTPLNNLYIQPFFRSALVGFCQDKSATTTGALAITTDGGTTWSSVAAVGNVFTNDMAYVPGTASTWITTGAATGLEGVTYSFDDGLNWTDMTETIGTQFLATTWVNDSVGWAGGFAAASPPTGGMYKFTGVLAAPQAAFSASDTAIELGGTVQFTDESTGGITAWHWIFQGGTPGTSNVKNPTPITYSASGAHDVTLKVTNAWGDNTLVKAGYIYVGGFGINELSNVTIEVYPNPVKDVMKVQSNEIMKEIQIFNIIGQSVYNQKVDSKNLSINASNLKPGVYNMKIKFDCGFINKKVVIN